MGNEEATRLLRVYGEAFPHAYQEDHAADVAVADLLRRSPAAGRRARRKPLCSSRWRADQRRLKLFSTEPVSLSTAPILQGMGVEVIDEARTG